MWNTIICDDEAEMRSSIRAYLERFETETGESFSVAEYASAEQLLFHLTEETDLLFLDIRMDGITGMEAAHRIRERNQQLCIVFIATMTQYAMEGYRVHAFGFLEKPLVYAQFRLQMLDVLRHLGQRRAESIVVRADGELRTVALTQLIYLEVLNHDLRFVFSDGSFQCRETLRGLEGKLIGKGFFRCHKSFCVNLRHVRGIAGEGVRMSNGDLLPVGKLRRKEFLEAYAAYAGGGMP